MLSSVSPRVPSCRSDPCFASYTLHMSLPPGCPRQFPWFSGGQDVPVAPSGGGRVLQQGPRGNNNHHWPSWNLQQISVQESAHLSQRQLSIEEAGLPPAIPQKYVILWAYICVHHFICYFRSGTWCCDGYSSFLCPISSGCCLLASQCYSIWILWNLAWCYFPFANGCSTSEQEKAHYWAIPCQQATAAGTEKICRESHQVSLATSFILRRFNKQAKPPKIQLYFKDQSQSTWFIVGSSGHYFLEKRWEQCLL